MIEKGKEKTANDFIQIISRNGLNSKWPIT